MCKLHFARRIEAKVGVRKSEDEKQVYQKMRGKWKGSEEERGEEGWRVSGVSLDKGLVRKTRGKTVRLPVPG